MYLVRGEELIEMAERPYELEEHLQRWIAQHPSLLAGDQINGDSPRRWLLVSRELAVPGEEGGGGRWSLDHLFLDQDAIPTLVEVKRSSDTRARREVVAQMLDYAANGTKYWPIEAIRAEFIARCEKHSSDPDAEISQFLGPDADVEIFWQTAKRNLEEGNLRLLFVADTIPSELRRIIEFLNAQMDRTEVLAVEIKHFVGQGVTTLVPRVLGQTERAQQRKISAGPMTPKRSWDETQFFDALNDVSPGDISVARRLLEWAKPYRIAWGKGQGNGSFGVMLDHNGVDYGLFYVWTSGGVSIEFRYLATRPPFEDEGKRREFLRRLNAIPGMSRIGEDRINGGPSFRLSVLRNDDAFDAFKNVMDWLVRTIRQHNS